MHDIMQDMVSKIRSSIKTLNYTRQELGRKEIDIDNELSNIKAEQINTCAEIDIKIDLMIKQLETHRMKLKNEVTNNDSDYVKELQDGKKHIQDMISEIEAKISTMQVLITTQELDVLKDSLDNLKANIQIPKMSIKSVKTSTILMENVNGFYASNYIRLKKNSSQKHIYKYEFKDIS
jgi:hypothetical protein